MIARTCHLSLLTRLTVTALLISSPLVADADPNTLTVEEGRLYVARLVGRIAQLSTNPEGLIGAPKAALDAANKRQFDEAIAFTQRNRVHLKNLELSEEWLSTHRDELIFAMDKPNPDERDAFLMYILFNMFPLDPARADRVAAYDRSKETGPTAPYEDPSTTVLRMLQGSNQLPESVGAASAGDTPRQKSAAEMGSRMDTAIAKALGKGQPPAASVSADAPVPSVDGIKKRTDDYTLAWIVGGAAVIFGAFKLLKQRISAQRGAFHYVIKDAAKKGGVAIHFGDPFA